MIFQLMICLNDYLEIFFKIMDTIEFEKINEQVIKLTKYIKEVTEKLETYEAEGYSKECENFLSTIPEDKIVKIDDIIMNYIDAYTMFLNIKHNILLDK